MTNDYSTTTDVKSAFIESSDYSSSDYDTIFSALITVASRLVDREVGRWDGFFYPTTDEQTLYYNGSGEDKQDINEFVSITSVSVSADGSLDSTSYNTLDSTSYWGTYCGDYNYSFKGKPINRIELDTLNTTGSTGEETCFWSYPRSVKVVGVPGWSLTCPKPIQEAVKIQVIRWFMRSKQNYMDVSSNGAASPIAFSGKARLDPDVKLLLVPYIMELMP